MRTLLRQAAGAISVLLAWIVAAALWSPAQAQTLQSPTSTETVLHNFTGTSGDGVLPRSSLIQDPAGNLYGTTLWGGNAPHSQYCSITGCGIVFKIDKQGNETVLYQFSGANGDGYTPEGGLVRDAAGNLYGATSGGGDPFIAAGVVYKIDPNGNETVLYTFEDGDGNGGPTASLTLDSHGNLFGTTTDGGANNRGTVFKLDSNGAYSLLYTFTGGADGSVPYRAGVVIDTAGNLYGVTNYGGTHGNGVIYKLTPTGQETVLYSFTGGNDGANPLGTLVRDKAGNFYGVTNLGGPNGNGTVFRLTTSGQLSVIYSFAPGIDGEPLSGVALDSLGNLYGTTTFGGTNHRGSIFKLTTSGTLTTLHSFSGGSDGGRPVGGVAGLTSNTRGVLYGTTVDGGTYSGGTVFELLP